MYNSFDEMLIERERTPEDERARIIQNLLVSAHVVRSTKNSSLASILENAAESYGLLFDKAYVRNN